VRARWGATGPVDVVYDEAVRQGSAPHRRWRTAGIRSTSRRYANRFRSEADQRGHLLAEVRAEFS